MNAIYARIAQLEAHWLGTGEDSGSNLAIPLKKMEKCESRTLMFQICDITLSNFTKHYVFNALPKKHAGMSFNHCVAIVK